MCIRDRLNNYQAIKAVVDNNLHKTNNEDTEKLFNENYKELLKNPISEKPFKIWVKKRLKPFNTICIDNKGKQELLVPYQDIETGKIVACQRRFDGTGKLKLCSVRGSQKKSAIHIVQKSEQIDPDLHKILGVIAEGVSTASEIAEALPNAFVVCGTGLTSLLGIYLSLIHI